MPGMNLKKLMSDMSLKLDLIRKAEDHILKLENSVLTPYDFERELTKFRQLIDIYNDKKDDKVPRKIYQSLIKIKGYLKNNPGTQYQPTLFEKEWWGE